MIFTFALIAIVIGTLMPLQAGLNAELTRNLQHPFLGAFISLVVGAIALGGILLFTDGFSNLKRLNLISPHLFFGGILGAIFVTSSMFLIPRMGATAMIGAFITGQLLGSVIIDHFGFLGVPVNTINLTKLIGVIFLFAGVFLILKKAS